MKAAARKLREWIFFGCGGVLGLALVGGGEPVRGALVSALGYLLISLRARSGS